MLLFQNKYTLQINICYVILFDYFLPSIDKIKKKRLRADKEAEDTLQKQLPTLTTPMT